MCSLCSLYSLFNKSTDISVTTIELAVIISNFYKYGPESMINQKTYSEIGPIYWMHLNRQPKIKTQHKIPTDFCYIDKNSKISAIKEIENFISFDEAGCRRRQ